MMKKTILTAILCCPALLLSAQTTVKGVLADKPLGEGEPYATARVYKQGSQDKPAAMFLTDAEGRFSHAVSGRGKFDIVFSSVGKEDLRHTIEVTDSGTLDLDTLYIKDNATALKGVEIVAQKPLVKMEVYKMSYNTTSRSTALPRSKSTSTASPT